MTKNCSPGLSCVKHGLACPELAKMFVSDLQRFGEVSCSHCQSYSFEVQEISMIN